MDKVHDVDIGLFHHDGFHMVRLPICVWVGRSPRPFQRYQPFILPITGILPSGIKNQSISDKEKTAYPFSRSTGMPCQPIVCQIMACQMEEAYFSNRSLAFFEVMTGLPVSFSTSSLARLAMAPPALAMPLCSLMVSGC